MPPAKTRVEDGRSEASTIRERQVAAAAHARKSKQAAAAAAAAAAASSVPQNGSSLKELALVQTESGNAVGREKEVGVSCQLFLRLQRPRGANRTSKMAWTEAPLELLNTYRVVHNLPTPAAFTSPLRQALLTNPGIGRQSPTMARRKDKRSVSKKELGVAVRKHFNGAAINEIDVVVEMVYKVRNKGRRRMKRVCLQALRVRSKANTLVR
jgi:histone deacetylase complex subunit SAP30